MSCEFKNISFSYPGKKVLKKINLTIEPGKITTMLGPNGSGKTTFVKTFKNTNEKQNGEIFIDSKNIKNLPVEKLAQKRAILSQKTNLPFGFSVNEIISMGRFPHPESDNEKIVEEVLTLFNLQEFRNRNYLKLSSGEQQRVNIARSVAQIWNTSRNEKRYLLLDEPTSSLDVQFQVQLAKTLEKIKKKNIGILIVLHDINLALSISDEITLLSEGEIYKSFSKPFSEKQISKGIKDVFKTDFETLKMKKGMILNPFFSND